MALASTAAAGVTQSEMGNQLKTAAMSVISHVEAAQGHSLLAPFGKGNYYGFLRARRLFPLPAASCVPGLQFGADGNW